MYTHIKKIIFLFLFLTVSISVNNPLFAQRVDTVSIYSSSMDKQIKNVVMLPSNYDKSRQKNFPVVYLLHGYNNRYDGWLKKIKPDLPQCTDTFGVIIVCPDGESSWYWDSPMNPKSRFETYISQELTNYMDTHYRTIARRNGRAVSGFSMGGHGALWLAFRHPDIFGACGSMSGGVDFRPFPKNWKISEQLGTYAENPKIWDEHTVMSQLYRIKPYFEKSREVAGTQPDLAYPLQSDALAIIIDCGTEDFFYPVNEELHRQMLYMNIAHDYITRKGAHTHPYWRNAVDYQLLFFNKFFSMTPQEPK